MKMLALLLRPPKTPDAIGVKVQAMFSLLVIGGALEVLKWIARLAQ